MKVLLPFVLFSFLTFGLEATAQLREMPQQESDDTAKMQAFFVEESVELDGFLNEEVWQQAVAISDFKQHEPVDGLPATHQTEVRVLYGSNSLYIGALLHDTEPAAIEQALGRRDDYNRADWFLISVDSYFDRRTAYTFGVNAAGVQFDAIQASSNSGGGGGGRRGGSNTPRGMDASWDAIWFSNARVTSEGWMVEVRIPYSMLRFSENPEQTWGIHFTRRIPRLGEQSEWPHVPRVDRDNLVARFGELTGIQNVNPRRNLQITPYTVTQLQTEENPDAPGQSLSNSTIDVGGDLKVGLGPNVTLDATINPDFGQVEADPAVLNLTAFETFFQERRPFFVEGIQIYEFAAGPGRLLYTRRIGAEAPIIGATKLSGRTASGLSFGVLGVATGNDFKPSKGYGVARVSQQVGDYSSVGGIVTAYDNAAIDEGSHLRSYSAGADWDLRFGNNQYDIEGFLSVTNRNYTSSDIEGETGFAGKIWARKRQGTWNGFVGFDLFSDKFNPNDIGQLRQNNFYALISNIEHQVNGGKPFGPFLRSGARGSFFQQFSYREGLNLGQSVDIGSRSTLRGFQTIRLGIELAYPLGGYDIYETRGLLPWAPPSGFNIDTSFETDERRNWQLEPGLDISFFEDGGREYEISLEGKWSAGSRVSLFGEISGSWGNNVTAWSSNESFLRSGNSWLIGRESAHPDDLSDADFAAFEGSTALDAILPNVEPVGADHYYVSLFGSRDTRSADFTLRSTVTFTPKLSLQLYSQLFVARGKYDKFQVQENRDQLTEFDAFPKRDEFSLSSLQSNVVLRWEYRPGSSLFVVWTHGRKAEDILNPLAPWNNAPYDQTLNNQLDDTFDIFPQNVFLIKLNYTFLY